ncbi:MAG TPA: aldo/keto reductase [Rubricoccaceae bacterium]|nr:aldo/keto reductase [Rubricoccaceae bacterium]
MRALDVHGVPMPVLGLGTWLLRGDACRRAVADALAVGYRHVDTAEMYENEEAVRRGMADSGVPRADVFLTTKVWRDHLRRADLPHAVAGSLRRLGTDYVDLLLVHWPNEAVPLDETLGALQEVQAAGKARLIGVSNFPAPLLQEALALAPDLACDQVEYHILLGQEDVLDVVRPRGMVLTAYSPLARGRVAKDETVQTIAAVHGVSASHIALAWLLRQDRVAVIPKASTREHLEANLAALDFQLSDEETAALDALPKHRRFVSPDWAPPW